MNSLNFGYWLFSTLVQAMAALFAVVGVFIVFKIQTLKEELSPLFHDAKIEYLKISPKDKYYMVAANLQQVLSKYKEIIEQKQKRKKELNGGSDKITFEVVERDILILEARMHPLEKIHRNLKDIKKRGAKSLSEIGTVFIFSLFLLFVNPFILKEKLTVAMGILAGICTLITVVHIIRIIVESLNIEQD